MAEIETRMTIGTDANALAAGMEAMRTVLQEMRTQFAGLGATTRKAQSQISNAMTQIVAAMKSSERSWRQFASPIEHKISDALTDAVLGIRQRGGMREVMLGIEKSVVGGMMNNVVKGIGTSLVKPLFTSLLGSGGIGGGIANFLFNSGTETTKISLLSIIAANTTAIAGTSAVTAASTGTSAATGGVSGLFSAIGAIPVIGKIGSFIAGIFDQGGIVPSAAGGWALPSFAGGMPAMLHGREMVLPADISEGLQGMIRGGGSGDVHVHNHFHGPADGASVGRWFSSNRSALTETIRDAWNSGALAFP